MYNQHIQGCSFIVCNTDSQALEKSNVPIKIRIGDGLGAGTNPAKARNAALESQDVIAEKVVAGHQAALADLISLAARLSGIPRKRLTLLKKENGAVIDFPERRVDAFVHQEGAWENLAGEPAGGLVNVQFGNEIVPGGIQAVKAEQRRRIAGVVADTVGKEYGAALVLRHVEHPVSE